MKELYIRKGNSKDTRNIIIVGEEQYLGSRDSSGYKPSKGAVFNPLKRIDPYSKSENLTYIHATPNIRLDTDKYPRDYQVHSFIKEFCTDLVKWDGEAYEGIVNSREAFVIKGKDIDKIAWELYKRIETEVHGGIKSSQILIKKSLKALGLLILLPFRLIISILILFFTKGKRKRTKLLQRIWN